MATRQYFPVWLDSESSSGIVIPENGNVGFKDGWKLYNNKWPIHQVYHLVFIYLCFMVRATVGLLRSLLLCCDIQMQQNHFGQCKETEIENFGIFFFKHCKSHWWCSFPFVRFLCSIFVNQTINDTMTEKVSNKKRKWAQFLDNCLEILSIPWTSNLVFLGSWPT